MANIVTNKLLYELATGDANLDAADLRCLLLKSSAPTVDTNVVDDLTPGTNESTATGYSRQALANETVTEDDTNDFAYLDADDAAFGALSGSESVTWAIVFRHTGADGTAPVYAGYDVTDTPVNGSTITIQWATPANGGALKIGR